VRKYLPSLLVLAVLTSCRSGVTNNKGTTPVDQLILGDAFHDGNGVPEDHAEAVRLWRKAADAGLVEARWRVDGGDGVPQDYSEAARWFRKAADAGYASGQQTLAAHYAAAPWPAPPDQANWLQKKLPSWLRSR
jgi:TPR repeat protein